MRGQGDEVAAEHFVFPAGIPPKFTDPNGDVCVFPPCPRLRGRLPDLLVGILDQLPVCLRTLRNHADHARPRRRPAAENMDIDAEGRPVGLF